MSGTAPGLRGVRDRTGPGIALWLSRVRGRGGSGIALGLRGAGDGGGLGAAVGLRRVGSFGSGSGRHGEFVLMLMVWCDKGIRRSGSLSWDGIAR
jgi:hypothetical protein